MSRRRGQRRGYLRIDCGSWLLTYRIYDQFGRPKRETVTIGPATGADKLTKKQADRVAWDHYLSKVDQISRCPKSMMTVEQFWNQKFSPTMELRLKKSTRLQYQSLYLQYILPTIGKLNLAAVTPDHIEQVVLEALKRGKSKSTAGHVRKVCSALFTRARKSQTLLGDNPATMVDIKLPKTATVRIPQALSPEQITQVLSLLNEPYRTMALTCILTSMNIAEVCGLRWRHVNLSAEKVVVDGEVLEPYHIAVREHFCVGQRDSLKTSSRCRNIPIPQILVSALSILTLFPNPESPVFCSKNGTPINANNTQKRHLAPIGKSLGIPHLGWHTFRHTHATLTNLLGGSAVERMRLMGHSSISMTDRYTHEDKAKLREMVDSLASLITPINSDQELTSNISQPLISNKIM